MKNLTNYILRSNGEEFTRTFKVKSIMVLNEANKIPRARILLIDGDVSMQDFELSNSGFFDPGNEFEIEIGYENEVHLVFKGIITRHSIKVRENTSELELECKHKAVKLTLNQGNRFFYDVTDREIIEEILGAESIDHFVGEAPDYKHQQIVQFASADWDFILSRTDANGMLVFSEGDRLNIVPPNMDQEEVLSCEYGRNVLEFEASINNEYQTPRVEAKAWSPDNQEVITSEGSAGFSNPLGKVDSATLAQAWGQSSSSLQHHGNLTEDELTAWSGSRATKNELAKVIGRVRIKGSHEVLPGKLIKLEGFGDRFSGAALVTGIRHELQKGNWTTDVQFGLSPEWFLLKTSKPALFSQALLPAVQGCHIGVVTGLEDPDGSFRVKVKIPVLNEGEEGVWARIIQTYAGSEYGAFFYPEIGDEVVVGFLNDDSRHAVLLGSLHSNGHPAPENPTDENNKKGIYTRSGLTLTFDDENKIVEIATSSGNKISLDESAQSINITDEHSNSVVMKSGSISLESQGDIEMKSVGNIKLEAVNINMKASGKFTAEGNAGADVKSSGIAVLKGALVQIN